MNRTKKFGVVVGAVALVAGVVAGVGRVPAVGGGVATATHHLCC